MIPHDHETEHDRVTYWRGSKDESRREKTSVIFVISVKYSINRWDLLLLGQMVGSKAKAPTSVPESFPARYSPHPSFSTSPSSGENPSSTLSSGFMPYGDCICLDISRTVGDQQAEEKGSRGKFEPRSGERLEPTGQAGAMGLWNGAEVMGWDLSIRIPVPIGRRKRRGDPPRLKNSGSGQGGGDNASGEPDFSRSCHRTFSTGRDRSI